MMPPLQTLFAAWIEPDENKRLRFPVARLDRTVDEAGHARMRLRYVEGVEKAIAHGFRPFQGMSDLDHEYCVSGAFFMVRQRIMRPSRPEYLGWLASLGWANGFDTAADPFRVLVRSGGRNATDRLEFFAPIPLANGQWRFEFFVRYIRGNETIAQELAAGQHPIGPLRLTAIPDNPVDPTALAVCDAQGRRVGLVPAYYSRALHAADTLPDNVEVLALNPPPETSAHRLLVACDVSLPTGWTLESSDKDLAIKSSRSTKADADVPRGIGIPA